MKGLRTEDFGHGEMNAIRQLWSNRHRAAGAFAYWSGAGFAFEAAARPSGAIILMYHSVAAGEAAAYVDPPNWMAPDLFERQMVFLREHRSVIGFSALMEMLDSGVTPPPRTVCITFDDGYLDNLTVAAPILGRLGLEATLFLATGYVERTEAQWADVLHASMTRRTRDRLRLPGLLPEEVNLRSAPENAAARRLLHRRLLQASWTERGALLSEINRQLLPQGRSPRLTLGWEEVRELRRRFPNIEIGGHTRDHVDLRTHGGEEARAQVQGCADDLRRELGTTPAHFSFPYGRWSPESQRIVRATGWRTAVGAGEQVRIGPESDRFAIPRVEGPRSMTELRFTTSGAFPGVLAMLGLD